MEDKDSIIAMQRLQIKELTRKCSALEQEVALLEHELDKYRHVSDHTEN